MPFTNDGAQFLTYRMGSPLNNLWAHQIGIGSGSGTALVTNSTLVAERIRNKLTGSADFTTPRKVTYQGDFNSFEMSGTHLTEFGLFTTGFAILTGSTWQRESFGSIVFDGTNELQVQTTIEVIPG